ncbi:MAG: class I SAM-dependent methyltransferase [Planctomycetia bacterium]|nr:class I SAM-dependent methyltransferase [Planctomycetia bacterium]
MDGVADRIRSELAFHDEQATCRAHYFRSHPDHLQFDDNDYLDHETWVRPALAQLGDVRGLDVLDFGCGHGMAAVVLARSGARVTAFDLSPNYVAECQTRAASNGVALRALAADGERLPFADASFDRIWGNAVLHHLDLDIATRELRRVLRPGGVAVFCEPWAGNPLLNWARRTLPYRGKHRTVDESPLTPAQLREMRLVFGAVEVQGHQLLAMIRRVLPAGHCPSWVDRADAWLLHRFPVVQHWSRYMVLTCRVSQSNPSPTLVGV